MRSARHSPADSAEPLLSAARLLDSRPLDETDRAIIGLLQHDGRMPYREIARQLCVAEGTVKLRANRLMSSGALTIAAIADPSGSATACSRSACSTWSQTGSSR